MAKQKISRDAKRIELKKGAKTLLFLIHGYTGSPSDFSDLEKYIFEKANVDVKVIRLKGHGETIDSLDNLEYDDFKKQCMDELKKEVDKGYEIILGGLSLGAYLCLELALEFKVKGIILISPIYKYKFPFNWINILEPIIFKKKWRKIIRHFEKAKRVNTGNYDFVHLKGFKLIKQAKKNMALKWGKINLPCLIIASKKDIISHIKGLKIIKEKIKSKKLKVKIFENDKMTDHNIMYSPHYPEVCSLVKKFVEELR